MAAKFYKEVPVSEELPTQDGEYFTDQGQINFSQDRFYAFSPEWWLKEISEPEYERQAKVLKEICDNRGRQIKRLEGELQACSDIDYIRASEYKDRLIEIEAMKKEVERLKQI